MLRTERRLPRAAGFIVRFTKMNPGAAVIMAGGPWPAKAIVARVCVSRRWDPRMKPAAGDAERLICLCRAGFETECALESSALAATAGIDGQPHFEFSGRVLQQQFDAAPAERFLVDGNRRQRRRRMRGGRNIVETDDGDVVGYAQAVRATYAQRGERGGVVVREHRIGARTRRIEQLLHRACRAGVGVEAGIDDDFARFGVRISN